MTCPERILNIKTVMNQIHIKDIKDTDLVATLHMDDYFPESYPKPYMDPLVTFKEFTENVLAEIMEDAETDSVTEAFGYYTEGSGDGQENFCVVALRNGQLYTVLADREEE